MSSLIRKTARRANSAVPRRTQEADVLCPEPYTKAVDDGFATGYLQKRCGGELAIARPAAMNQEMQVSLMARGTDTKFSHGAQEANREAVVNAMIAVYRATRERFQGFCFRQDCVIRDLSRPWNDQVVWKREVAGDAFEQIHDAMMAEIERLRFGAVFDAVLDGAITIVIQKDAVRKFRKTATETKENINQGGAP